ncbi:hypothetical protein Angca_001670, partial [Angiostrongylus cantonensis]
VNTDLIHSESRKETNILDNALRRFRTRRGDICSGGKAIFSITFVLVAPGTNSPCSSSQRNESLLYPEVDICEVPCAAIPPSPRLETGAISSSHISVNERNIRLFQKRAEKIRRQHDDERRRVAQEIQRGLAECEIRLEEVKA